jgi:hypothetical protein
MTSGEQGIYKRLVDEYGYPPPGARVAAQRLAELSGAVREAFDHWWTSGEPPELEIGGFTLVRLAVEHGMNPIAAFLTLDWLARDPAAAHASLGRGHDQLHRESTTPHAG